MSRVLHNGLLLQKMAGTDRLTNALILTPHEVVERLGNAVYDLLTFSTTPWRKRHRSPDMARWMIYRADASMRMSPFPSHQRKSLNSLRRSLTPNPPMDRDGRREDTGGG